MFPLIFCQSVNNRSNQSELIEMKSMPPIYIFLYFPLKLKHLIFVEVPSVYMQHKLHKAI